MNNNFSGHVVVFSEYEGAYKINGAICADEIRRILFDVVGCGDDVFNISMINSTYKYRIAGNNKKATFQIHRLYN
jgi:hypothetical protein